MRALDSLELKTVSGGNGYLIALASAGLILGIYNCYQNRNISLGLNNLNAEIDNASGPSLVAPLDIDAPL